MKRAPHILLLYNEPVLPPDHPDRASELEILETIEIVGGLLTEAGFQTSRLGVGRDLTALPRGLRMHQPDAVFNLFEGLPDRPFTEEVVPGMLEWLDVPFTGSVAGTIALARDKVRTKTLLHGAGLPTPPFVTVNELPCPTTPLRWPVIVKPALQDCSVGIDQGSVISDQNALERRVEQVLERHGPVLIEQYIAGREFHVSIVQGAPDARGQCPEFVLPLVELTFENPALWPIYTYEAKWNNDSRDADSITEEGPVVLPAGWQERIDDVCKRAYRLLGCRDLARIDIRVTPAGEPYILEVNPNPYLASPGLIRGLETIGSSHAQFLADLARSALARATGSRVAAGPARESATGRGNG